jgi:hypothetical protein
MDDDQPDRSPPVVSRIGRTTHRAYRSLSRGERFQRARKRLPIDQLIGALIERRGLTDEVRQRVVSLYWLEIAGARIASKTFPVSLFEGQLRVSATTSQWVQEMQFVKTNLVRDINRWIDANRVWLGPPPLVTEIRIELASRHRELMVEREHAERLRSERAQRTQARPAKTPVSASPEQRDAILAETSTVADADLRALIESVRVKWSR